ncbi:hypothetical protein DPMN_189576 [Dreissena polymorpha]|uniref:Uncharacterized protein n=1 Tax=Dreissena polymorpha TaxID=45954 RepID=A0A9D4DT16_DREPO|nr:hypothetical protein DPMN_189576 [Dreissena polymorpha]
MLFQTVTLSSSWREQRIILRGCSAPCDVSLATKSPTCALHTSGCSDCHDHVGTAVFRGGNHVIVKMATSRPRQVFQPYQ